MKLGSRLATLLVLIIDLALVPWLLNPYLVFVTNLAFIYAILALGLNLVCYERRDRPFESGSTEIVQEQGRHASS